jgi:multicomponent Na+:H+ antiporter subunit E
MSYLFLAFVLLVFWLVLSGHFTALLVGFGLLSVALVTWFVRRMDRVDGQPCSLRPSTRLVGYLAWLIGEVVKANVDLARRIWHPALPIEPNWSRLDTRVETPLERTLYANSITLTPGTLTTDVADDHLMIHALSREGIEELRAGEMERRIRRLGL